jgi:general stress protein YciG
MPSESKRGFASMDNDKKRKISRKGGQSVADENRSFSKDHELASEAGRKGGEHSHRGQRRERDGEGHR